MLHLQHIGFRILYGMSLQKRKSGMEKKKIVVLSGSGIRAESGIATFRGGNGLWDNEPVEAVATNYGWSRDPMRVLRFYNKLRADLANAQPNDAHRIVARLEKDYDVCVVTQNVDNLHERAGSTNIIHLHGELTKSRPEDTYCEMDNYSERYVKDIGYGPILYGETGGPHNTQMRPHIVWFGEQVPNLSKAADAVSQADILLIIGTSLQVYPAAGLYHYAPAGCRIYMIDPDESAAAHVSGVVHIKDVATAGMRKFLELIEN